MNSPQERTTDGFSSATSQDSRTTILNGALSCFAKNGYFDTTFKDISQNAGLCLDDVKSYFSSKDEILAEYLKLCDYEIMERIQQDSKADVDELERIRTICISTLTYLGKHTELTAIWVEFYKHHVARVVLKQFFEILRARIRVQVHAGIAAGRIRNVEEGKIVEAIVELFEGTLILSRLEGNNDEVEQRFRASWRIMVSGLDQDQT